MKDITKAGNKFLYYEIARLRTLWSHSSDLIIKAATEARYAEVKAELISRGETNIWSHSMDNIVKDAGTFMKPNKPAWRIFESKEVFDLEGFELPCRVDLKIDGMREQVHITDKVEIFSEDEGFKKADKFKLACEDIKRDVPKGTVLDTEGVIVDRGEVLHRTTFIGYANGKGYDADLDSKAEFWCFDVLFWEGRDLRDEPYSERLKYLEKIKESDHLKKTYGIICKTEEEVLKAIEKIRKMKGAEGAMIKTLSGKIVKEAKDIAHNKTWVKLKNLKEIDCIVVEIEQPHHKKGPMEGKPVEGVFNYHIAAGPYPDKCSEEVRKKEPNKVREIKGKVYAYLGKTFNTEVKVGIGDIIRIWTPEVNRYEVKDVPGCYTFGIFEPKVLEHVAERNIPDSMNVLMRLSGETVPREVKKEDSNSIYLPRHSCMLIWSGIKNQIVKEKPFEGMLHKELYLCDDHYCYGELELTSMYEMSREKVKEDIHRNRVFGEDWEDWKGARVLHGYDFTFEAYFEPQVIITPKGAQTFFTLDQDQVNRIERVETSADFIGIMRKGFYIDEEDRVRFIPESEAEKMEYGERITLAKEATKIIPVKSTRERIEKELRKYRSSDLKKSRLTFVSDKELKVEYGKLGGEGSISGFSGIAHGEATYVVYGFREGSLNDVMCKETVHHELGHSIFYIRNNSFSSDYYGRLITPESVPKIRESLGSYALTNRNELVASAFDYMRRRPASTKKLMKEDPFYKNLFGQLQKDTGYKIVGGKEGG